MEDQVIKTKKGLFIRKDKDFGAIVFSPFSGLFFAVAKDYVEDTLKFCNKQKANLPDEIINNLNIGTENASKNFEIETQWLPNKKSFSYIDELPEKYPIVINWLISNKCFFKCNYCYASDVLDKEFENSIHRNPRRKRYRKSIYEIDRKNKKGLHLTSGLAQAGQ